MYYNREHLESVLETWFRNGMIMSKAYIDEGGDNPDTIYWDMELYAPVYTFLSSESLSEYRAIVNKWNARFRAEIDDYRREHKEKERRAAERSRFERERREENRRSEEAERKKREEVRRRAEEEERRLEEEKRQKREEARRRAEEKRKEQDKKNREALNKIQAEWKEKHSSPESTSQPEPTADCLYCTSCGAPNTKIAKFCKKCGTQLQIACPSCGQLVRVGSKFCTKCGTKLN